MAKQNIFDNETFFEGYKATIVNTLTENGFYIEKMIEPIPTDEIL